MDVDDWTDISDPHLRKRVQNRLAQRASRARRRAIAPTPGPSGHDKNSSPTGTEVEAEVCSANPLTSPVPSSSSLSPFSDPASDTHFLFIQSMSTSNAFLFIGNMLNLTCSEGMSTGYNIRAPLEIIPATLKPTSLQTSIPHWPYVDMIPWSSLRDRILNSLDVINENELIHDIAVNAKWRVWGAAPWDPMSWELDPDFAKKWWFLLDEGMMRTTNFWRLQRGEQPLVVEAGNGIAATAS